MSNRAPIFTASEQVLHSLLTQILNNLTQNHKEAMSTAADLQTSQDQIVTLVTEANTNLIQMITDSNTAIAALKNQQVPVSQGQLDALQAKNLTIVTALQNINIAITAEDTLVAPPAAVPDPSTSTSTDASSTATATTAVPEPAAVDAPAAVTEPAATVVDPTIDPTAAAPMEAAQTETATS